MPTSKEYNAIIKEFKKAKIVAKFDIPYNAGYSWDYKKIYVDRDLPKFIKIDGIKLNLHQSLGLHEFVEKKYINIGYSYAGAHQIATSYEKQYVIKKGISWKRYDRDVGKLMRINFVSKMRSIPKDLDLTPYNYSRDIPTLTRIRKVLA